MRVTLAFLVLIGLSSCGSKGEGSSSSNSKSDYKLVVSDQAMTQAKQVFINTCAACHGESGKGDGAASKALVPPPRNLTSAEWQNSVDDEYIAKIIQYGGGSVGKSIAMPNNPAIGADQKLLKALVAYVRSLKE